MLYLFYLDGKLQNVYFTDSTLHLPQLSPSNYYQVQAIDAAGNHSDLSAKVHPAAAR